MVIATGGAETALLIPGNGLTGVDSGRKGVREGLDFEEVEHCNFRTKLWLDIIFN